ncbi:MAG: hypothetical protein WDM92_00830 [Caulobacteraceae bacterium]
MRGWLMVAICLLGISTGPAAVKESAIGIFMETFQHNFGWTRAEISSAISLSMMCAVVASPIVGALGGPVRPPGRLDAVAGRARDLRDVDNPGPRGSGSSRPSI